MFEVNTAAPTVNQPSDLTKGPGLRRRPDALLHPPARPPLETTQGCLDLSDGFKAAEAVARAGADVPVSFQHREAEA